MEEISPEDYEQLVDKITKEAATDFQRGSRNAQGQRQACCRYFKRGDLAGLSRPELIDFLAVSTPSILELAGYTDKEAQAVMDLITDISEDEIDSVVM